MPVPLRLPTRFLRTTQPRYAPVALAEGETTPAPTPHLGDRFMGMVHWMCNYREYTRQRQITRAIAVLESTQTRLSEQAEKLDVELGILQHDMETLHSQNRKKEAVSKLKQWKLRKVRYARVASQLVETEQQLAMLNELRDNQDVVSAVRSVAVAMKGLHVQSTVEEVDDATAIIEEASDDVRELTQSLTRSHPEEHDNEALLRELDAVVNGDDGPSNDGAPMLDSDRRKLEAALARLPSVPTGLASVVADSAVEVAM